MDIHFDQAIIYHRMTLDLYILHFKHTRIYSGSGKRKPEIKIDQKDEELNYTW